MRMGLGGWLVAGLIAWIATLATALTSGDATLVSASPAVILAVIVLSALGGLVLGRLAMDRQAGPGDGNTADEQLRQQAKAIAELSHAVRTPLNSVIGFSEIMRGEMFGPLGNERYRDYADHIQEDAKVLLARVDDIIRTAETTHRRAA